MAGRSEHNIGAPAAIAFDSIDNVGYVNANLIVLVERRGKAIEPSEIGAPIAKVIPIGTAKRNDRFTTAIFHAPPNVKFEAVDGTALWKVRWASQAPERSEMTFPISPLEITDPRPNCLMEREFVLISCQRWVRQETGIRATSGVQNLGVGVGGRGHHRVREIERRVILCSINLRHGSPD
jgi:hypothetical protein